MKFLKNIFFFIMILPFVCFAISDSDLQKVMKEYVDAGYTPGIVVGIIDQNSTKFFKYGHLAIDDETLIDENTIFETGSISKIFTSLLLAEMVKNKEVNFSDPIEKYLPSYVRVASYLDKKITLEHLATHTAGFDYMPDNFVLKDLYNPFYEYSLEDLYSFLSTYDLKYAPGNKYHYSNIGIGILGHVLALHMNKNIEDLVVERLLNPLGMDSTRVTLTSEMQKRFAKAHIKDKIVPYWDMKPFFASVGGFRTTPKDLARLIQAYLGFYQTDLFPIMQETIKARQKQDIPYLDVGYEWNISYKYQPEIIYHGGATGGHQLFIGFCPQKKIGVVVASNSCACIYEIGKNVLHDKWHLKNHREQIMLFPALLNKFVGEYETKDKSVCTISLLDQGYLSSLLLKWGFYPKAPIYPSSDKDFFMKVKNVEINFILSEQDEQIVEGMKVTSDGKIYNFIKKK